MFLGNADKFEFLCIDLSMDTCWCMCFLSSVNSKTTGVEAACAVFPKPGRLKVVFVNVNRIIV